MPTLIAKLLTGRLHMKDLRRYRVLDGAILSAFAVAFVVAGIAAYLPDPFAIPDSMLAMIAFAGTAVAKIILAG